MLQKYDSSVEVRDRIDEKTFFKQFRKDEQKREKKERFLQALEEERERVEEEIFDKNREHLSLSAPLRVTIGEEDVMMYSDRKRKCLVVWVPFDLHGISRPLTCLNNKISVILRRF